MNKYPCGICGTEENMPTYQWVMFGRLNKDAELKGDITRYDLDDSCAVRYLSKITRIRNSQNGNRPDPVEGTPAVKDGWHPGEVYTLTEDNYEAFIKWINYRRQKKQQALNHRRV